MHLPLILAVIFAPLIVDCLLQCPAVYKRLSQNHSYCKSRNPKCRIISSGLKSESEKEIILSEHNKYRSKCAVGDETGAGGLPTAADMMELVWDEELAATAQKWAEQCHFQHDCNSCRAVYSFAVGQNLAYKQWYCLKPGCPTADDIHPRDWASVIKMFTNEIKIFDKSLVESIQFENGDGYGHLTQILWAKTWRIGCGYVSHLYGNNLYRQLYVCNYGPSGNIISKPIYTVGKPCSQCPSNTCCGESCTGGIIYPGLCRVLEGVPMYYDARRNTAIFNSDFRKDSLSDMTIKGLDKWWISPTYSGNILNIVLNGGESSTLNFNQVLVPSEAFCVTLKYRKGPNVAGRTDSNELEMIFEPKRMLPIIVHVDASSSDVFTYNLDLGWKEKTKFGLKFSVPPTAPPQYLDVLSILVTNGACSTNDKI